MAILYKALKRRVNGSHLKPINAYDTLSTGINYAEGKQTIWLHDHVVLLTDADVTFLLEHLKANQITLRNKG